MKKYFGFFLLIIASTIFSVGVSAPSQAAVGDTSTISVGSGPVTLAFSPNGSRAYVANRTAGTISTASKRYATTMCVA